MIAALSANLTYSQSGRGDSDGGKIIGRIVDNETNQPIARANVNVVSAADSSIVTGGITDNSGRFEINILRQGNYFVRVNYVGYSPYISGSFNVSRENREIDLKTINLKISSAQTDVIDVVGERQMIEYSHGKRIFHVDKNLAAAGGTAIDVLKNIPSVNVDVDGNISLRGTSNFRVLLNGRPTSLPVTVLMEQLPAESVESIEIITNPSARYEAEGMGGIINVILKKNREQGLNGLASINIGTLDKYSFSLNTSYQLNGLNLFANYDFGSRRMRATGSSFRTTIFDNSETVMEQDIRSRRNSMNHTIRTGFDYQLTSADLLSMSVMYRTSESSRYGGFTSSNLQPNSLDIINQTNRLTFENGTGPNYDYSLNYRRNFGVRDHNLTFDFNISQRYSDDETDYKQSITFPNPSDLFFEYSDSEDLTKNMNLQADYVLPMGDYKFETGARLSFQTLDGNYNHFYKSDPLMKDWIIDANKSNHFVYDEQILAAYAIFSGKYKNLSYQAGLRAEQSAITTDLKTTNEKNERDYFDFFPSASLSYKLTKSDEIQLNYSRRINRPRSRFLNPFVDYSDPNNLRSGNPNLNPEYIDAYEVAYLKNFKAFSVTPTVFYRRSYDKFAFIANVIEPGVFKTTFENMAEGTNYGLELNITFDYFKWMRLSTDFSYYRSEIKGAANSLELENNDYNWTLRANASIFATRELSIQLIGNYVGPTVTLQGQRYEMYFFDIGARYDIFGRQATITFRLSDVFNQMSFGSSAEEAGRFYTRYLMKRESRTAYLGLQYKINEGPKQRERRRQQQDAGGLDFDEF